MPHSVSLTPENLRECENVKNLLNIQKHSIGMTHKMLGRMIGKSDKSISAIVNGRMRVTVPVGRKLAKALGVPLSAILPWTAELSDQGDMVEFIENYRNLEPENRVMVERVLRNLLEAQEDP